MIICVDFFLCHVFLSFNFCMFLILMSAHLNLVFWFCFFVKGLCEDAI